MVQEDEFYREQEKLRAEIRMKSGRGEPIDILTKYIHDEGHADLDFGEPYHIVDGISLEAVKKLRDGIQFQLEIDPDGEHSAFWAAMLTVVEFELERQEEQRERSRMQSGRARYEGGMHRSVAADVDELLRGKGKVVVDKGALALTSSCFLVSYHPLLSNLLIAIIFSFRCKRTPCYTERGR